MNHHSEASRVTFDIRIPDDLRLLGPGEKMEFGDYWYNFHTFAWELVTFDFLGASSDYYIAARSNLAIQESELPEWPKGG